MEIILSRHTQVENPGKLCYGHYPIPLASDFVLQANEVKLALSNFSKQIKPQIIYSSPAERCMKLAEILASSLHQSLCAPKKSDNVSDFGNSLSNSSPREQDRVCDIGNDLQIVSDDRLKEMNFGEWEGMPWIEIPSIELFAWMDNYVHMPAGSNRLGSNGLSIDGNFNGESYMILYHRTKLFIEEYLLGTKGNKLVISHAGPIRTMLAFFLNLNLYEAINLKVPYGCIFRISLNPDLKAVVYPMFK